MDERSRPLGLRGGGCCDIVGASERAGLGGVNSPSSSFPGLTEDSTSCCVANGLDVLSDVDSAFEDDVDDVDENEADGLCLQS